MPEVSVIIPIYNTAAYLRRTLDSICSQTPVSYTHLTLPTNSRV